MKLFRPLNIGILLILLLFIFIGKQFTISNGNLLSQKDSTIFHPNYYKLQEALSRYEVISGKGGWDFLSVAKGKTILETNDPVFSLLRKRLENENYLYTKNVLYPDSFDADLKNALKLYQVNNGLMANGILEATTIASLNITVEDRIKQIKLNMERWKHLPNNLGKHYLFVNTADFSLIAVKNDTVALKMKTIVGRSYRKTPVFSAKLTHIVFNPTWNIPPNILKKDILPQVKKDIKYLEKKHIRVFRTDSFGNKKQISAAEINWNQLIDNSPLEFVQDPGPENAMGAVKFVFPNRYYVYMHDTPSKDLFEEPEPMYSSGCIRLSKAVDLARHLLENEKSWTDEKVSQVLKSGKMYSVYIENPIDVYIQYFTAWVDDNGTLQFRKDIYNRDYPLFVSLHK